MRVPRKLVQVITIKSVPEGYECGLPGLKREGQKKDIRVMAKTRIGAINHAKMMAFAQVIEILQYTQDHSPSVFAFKLADLDTLEGLDDDHDIVDDE